MIQASEFDVIIIGAGHAGAQAAIALRQQDFAGSIAIIGNETEPPYERPSLSKEYLSGTKTFDRILIRPKNFWSERAITLLLGQSVVSLDPDQHHVTLGDGGLVGYTTLIWAAGGSPRSLSCAEHDLRGVHSVRARADVDRMLSELEAAKHVVVIGGGYIGLEAAAVLRKLGKKIVVLEAQDRVLARVCGEPLSRFYEAEHRVRGVDIRTGVAVDCIVGTDDWAKGVRLRDGTIVPADMVIVGIGIIPAVQPLLAAGATGGNGVNIDEFCQTSLPDVYAIGDCAAHVSIFADGARIRLESVQNANDQAAVAAKAIVGSPTPYQSVPWFWSNQYDLRLQTVGLSTGFDDLVVRGNPSSRSFSIVYLKAGRVIALDCVNATKDYVQGRSLVLNGARTAPEHLQDQGVALKQLAAA